MARTPHQRVILDMDSSESRVYGEQEGAAYNGHFETVCYHPLFRFNEVMKVLSVVAAILLPLSLLAGIHGMNFVNMPELQWHYGYFVVWCVMVLVTISLVVLSRNGNGSEVDSPWLTLKRNQVCSQR